MSRPPQRAKEESAVSRELFGLIARTYKRSFDGFGPGFLTPLLRAKSRTEASATEITGRSGSWSRLAVFRKNHYLQSRLNVQEELAWRGKGAGYDDLWQNVVLGCLAEMSRTFVFNPNKRIIGIMALIVHH